MENSEKNLDKTGNQKQNVDKIPQKRGKKSKTAKQLMDTHVKDENHSISDEEFKNLDVTAGAGADTAHERLDILEEKDRAKDEGKDHPIKTPWDVIGD